jgi:hypothetical protein
MSCNNTNNTCTNCNHNYSSCNNNCAKCGCKDSFLTSPPPCPTPEGCPDPIPCQEVLSSDCIIYNGPNISCNNTVIVTSDSTWAEVLEDLVDYFCITYSNVPLILCSGDTVVTAGSSVNSALQQIVSYFCTEISGLVPVTANNGLNINPASNVRLGGPLMQNTIIGSGVNSTFNLDITSGGIQALRLQSNAPQTSINDGYTLEVNPVASLSSARAIYAGALVSGFSSPVVFIDCQSAATTGSQALYALGKHNTENAVTPITTLPAVYIESASNTAKGATNSNALRLSNTYNGTVGSGVSIEFGNTTVAATNQAYITNRIISKTVVNTSESLMTSAFIIQGKPTGTVYPTDQLTLKSTSQLQLNKYGIGTFTGVPTYNLSTTALGDVIETTAGLFGTGFRASSPPLSIPFVTPSLANSEITNGVTIKPTVIYQLVNGVITTQYNAGTGVWTCPQTGKYDINYNVYLTTPSTAAFGWGDTAYTPTTGVGQFFIGVTNNGTTTYCADSAIIMNKQYLFHLYLTGGMQGVDITAGTTLVLKIQNMTGINYVTNSGDNIDWAIRRVG